MGNNMKKCPKCNSENNHDEVFCEDCQHFFMEDYPDEKKQSILLEYIAQYTRKTYGIIKFFYVIAIISLILGGIVLLPLFKK